MHLSSNAVRSPDTNRGRTNRRSGAHMLSEVENIREHWSRMRDVTIAQLAMLSDNDLAWRPRPDLFSCGQHFVHILQSEDFYSHGLFRQDWNIERLRFPSQLP